MAVGALPIGLAHGVPLTADIPAGRTVTFSDVALSDNLTVATRREAERLVA